METSESRGKTEILEDQGNLSIPQAVGDIRSILIIISGIIVFICIFTTLSLTRYYDFFTANWDFGIFQQMFWSNTHGRLLYESGDYITNGTSSFLQIHSGYITILFSYIYYLFPTPTLIFFLQTSFVSLAVFPLYHILLKNGLSHKKSVLFSMPILLNFALISAMFYDFHLESLIPLEFLSLYYLLTTRKYISASAVFLIGLSTLEVFPFLVVGIALLYLIDPKIIYDSDRSRKGLSKFALPLVLIVVSLGSYLAIRLIQYFVIPYFIGINTQFPFVHVYNSIFGVLVFNASPVTIASSTLYWLMLLASLAFLPLVRPKYLVLTLPWLFGSVFVHPNFSAFFGNQYAFVGLSTLLVGYAMGSTKLFGSNRVKHSSKEISSILSFYIPLTCAVCFPVVSVMLLGHVEIYLSAIIIIFTSILTGITIYLFYKSALGKVYINKFYRRFKALHVHRNGVVLTAVIASLLVFNFSMSPLDPANVGSTPTPGYDLEYHFSNLSAKVTTIASTIPNNSTVLSTDNLFPYVANRLNSYSLLWYLPNGSEYTPYFPFNETNLPEYLLLSSSELALVPTFISNSISNTSTYGMVYYITDNQSVGNIYLYHLGYDGKAIHIAS